MADSYVDRAIEANGTSGRTSTRVRRVFTFVGLAVYSLIFAELFVRIFEPQALMPRYVTGTAWGVRGNIPNARYWHHTPEVDVEYRINGQGMRADRDYSLAKPPGTRRVALFGDSFFMGYELDLKDTFAYKLEQRLNADGIESEVLNFSVSGFGTGEMIKTYENYARRFDPDVVIFQWHRTDPDDNVRSGLYRVVDGKVEPAAATYLPSIGVQDKLMEWKLYRLIADNSHLYSLVRETTAQSIKRLLVDVKSSDVEADGEETSAEAPAGSAAVELSGDLLLYARDMVEADGRRFVVIEVPRPETRKTYVSTAAVLPAAVRDQLEILSPLQAFNDAARPDLKLYYERGNRHLTPTAIDLLVGSVTPSIEEILE